jgi:hypothetical protein
VTRSTQTLAPEDGQPRADACGAKGEAPSLKPWNRAAGIRDPVTVMVLPWLLTRGPRCHCGHRPHDHYRHGRHRLHDHHHRDWPLQSARPPRSAVTVRRADAALIATGVGS